MSKPTKATKYIYQQAQFTRNSNVTVDCDSGYSTVAIDGIDDGVFMQGDEADTFNAEVEKLCKRYPSLDTETAELALAWPYVETLLS